MIFKPELVAKIRTGEKTQTRRPVKDGETECRYRAGHSYAVQSGRGKKASCRMIVTDVRRELLNDISDEDAQREGFKDREEFFAYWRKLYGTGPMLEIWVWVISFVLDRTETPRLLGKTGYVDDPDRAIKSGQEKPLAQPGDPLVVGPPPEGQGAPPEPEGVDEATQERFTAEGWERHAKRNPKPPLENRLRAVRREAQEKGVDATRLEASIERRVEAYERLIRSEAAV